jgi:hypothetical protein
VLEARLAKLSGVLSAKVRGYDKESRFYFNLRVAEGNPLLPSAIRATLEALKRETRGDDDYPYHSLEVASLVGTVQTSGKDWVLVARGSRQKYDLAPSDALKKLVASGASQVVVGGKLSDENGRLSLLVLEAQANAP